MFQMRDTVTCIVDCLENLCVHLILSHLQVNLFRIYRFNESWRITIHFYISKNTGLLGFVEELLLVSLEMRLVVSNKISKDK